MQALDKHLVRSLGGWISAPIPKFLLLFSKRGLTTRLASGLLTARGAAATFFPFLPFLATIFLLQSQAFENRDYWGGNMVST